MDRHSGSQAMESVPVDLVAEWAAPGGETGLEEPMWQLSLVGGPESYPERPSEPNCIYYLRTGFCGYGNRCRFNHPRDRSMAMGAFQAGGGEYPERVGQPVCQLSETIDLKFHLFSVMSKDIQLNYKVKVLILATVDLRASGYIWIGDFSCMPFSVILQGMKYYMRTGTCKFGVSCKYNHPKHGIEFSGQVTLNVYGYPLRPEEKECSYYVKTGNCKFGLTCKFHHPQPAGISVPVPAPVLPPSVYPSGPSPSVQSSQQYGVIQGNWPVARPVIIPGSYGPGSYGPLPLPPGVVPVPGWNSFTAPVSPVDSQSTQPAVVGSLIYGITQLSPSAAAYTVPYVSITSSGGHSSNSEKEHAYPERPDQPECQYFLRTGECKFGATCKYHHPSEWSVQKTTFVLSPMGLPLRPGAPLCSHYAQSRVCKFGPTCRFDHPMRTLSYSPSASSLTDIPVAPYPVGSTHPTLAPSSSSSNLRFFNRDAFTSSQMSSMNSPNEFVGPILSSSGGPIPKPGLQV
ncbi:zinc finger CCCH domain-containing protein 6 [Striga asiatica]|uniref:Zinc finger CCCH domain-containing protein 6 n=1 Tax=Striga asiatica TaxID=4170 RepID=A0A5A7QYK4_STRAF|nr:zinc finger CCCH domain-containing protein 6 [Striga asiatica]